MGDTSLHITKDHAIIGLGAGHVTSVGVPPSLEVPSSPEEAVRGVATATGDRVSAVPELILPPPRFVPQLAKWRITLTSNTRVKRTSDRTVLNTAILYFGFGGTWRTSGMFTGNSHLSTTRIVRDAGNGNATIALSMRDGYADVFELVTPEGQ
ncbi:MAG TPA: hypothetical protein VFK16_06415 [Gemmatimonadaceae bacterium]|nr:hypothetical protein [Gemmatimonadaceae bacterium]